MQAPSSKKGKVIIAGAGPGDPELLTLKAARFLEKADVVLVDRLVSEQIIENFISPSAEIIYVGKQCRRGISTPQQTINELMVHHALLGKLVVRLKGGDVSIFSNILDELETLAANNLSFEIIPGVTAALGAAAFAGIPLTARGYATSVRFLTCYKSDVVSENYWKELAATDDTLVFYMSSETLQNIVDKLTQYHIHEEKLVAIVEQATTPFQNVQIKNLYDLKKETQENSFMSPTLIIIGRVVSLHKNFKWMENNYDKKNYFKPLANQILPDLQPEKISNVS
jgi:uroporphyrin-III C-methyltransferase/precorrin-2 dehydrogenase/sirohydrochlorin ferrochelatase/uroporphyrin-III C-methyltransferase